MVCHVAETDLPDVFLLEPDVFTDDRGSFFEIWNAREFEDVLGVKADFVQDNQSVSKKGVLRGLHYQAPPHAQGKLIRILKGKVFDVAVDLRKSSPSFGNWEGFTLSADRPQLLWLPAGFAHGFCALTDDATFLYKVTAPYDPACERAIRWDDPDIGIEWPVSAPRLSPKDKQAKAFKAAELFA